MKAIIAEKYGSPDVLKFEEIQKPAPADNEVLLKVEAASVNAGDWHLLRANPFLIRLMFGLLKPKIKIFGSDVAGRVESVGQNVTQFQPGDEVFGDLSGGSFGAFAEYVAVPEESLVPKPANVSFEQAAAVPSAATTALQGLRNQGQIQAGQKVVVNGASGGVGSFAVQIAKALGAEVTGVCSTPKMEMVRSLGADHVIDYRQQDFTQNGQQYNLILDAGAYRSISDYKRALTPQGTYVMVGGGTTQLFKTMLLGPLLSKSGGQTVKTFIKEADQKDLQFLKELLETGKITPAIDRSYPLSEVPDAIRYLESGHAQGKVIITVGHNNRI